MFKKITKLMLAMLMAFSIMPISVSAEDYDQEEVELSKGSIGDTEVWIRKFYLIYPQNTTYRADLDKAVFAVDSDNREHYLKLGTDYVLVDYSTKQELSLTDIEKKYSIIGMHKLGIKGIGQYSGYYEDKNGNDALIFEIYDPYILDPNWFGPVVYGEETYNPTISIYTSETDFINNLKFVLKDSIGTRFTNLKYGIDYTLKYIDSERNSINASEFFSHNRTVDLSGTTASYAGNIIVQGIGKYSKGFTIAANVVGHEHTLKYTSAKAATCKTKGNVAYYTCTECGAKFSDKYCQKKLSTVTVSGTHNYNIYGKCSVCSALAPGLSAKVPTMKVKSISKGKGYLTVKWAKNSKVKGYQVRYSLKSNMSGAKTVTISKYKTTSKKIKSLKKKTTYYVQIRAFANVNGKKMYSTWSAVKSAKTK